MSIIQKEPELLIAIAVPLIAACFLHTAIRSLQKYCIGEYDNLLDRGQKEQVKKYMLSAHLKLLFLSSLLFFLSSSYIANVFQDEALPNYN